MPMTASSVAANCRKVICIGRNYADHIKELNNVRPKKPFFFLKPPSSILTPNAGPILRPHGVSLHYEVELALVMGRTVVDLPEGNEEEAIDSIAGYCVAIDMTARNLQDEAKKKGLPWTAAKGFDTFLPVSHFISKERVPDPHNATLYLTVNNEERQKDKTNLMLFKIPRILSEISRVMKLEEGDLVLTGTPKGVGKVEVGDVIRAGLSVEDKEVEEGRIQVGAEEKGGLFEYEET